MSRKGDCLTPRSADESALRPSGHGPDREMTFHFEGKTCTGAAGETIAKALFHNGIRTFSHSIKYGRNRSISCGRGRCVMCLVEVNGTPGVKACTTPIAEGMRIRRQHDGPFYAPLLTAVIRRTSFPAGFYYRMFTRPRAVRRMFSRTLRQMAGVGRIDEKQPGPRPVVRRIGPFRGLKDRYDVVIVGAGLSGMSAAGAAAGAGAEVLVVEEYAFLGGHAIGHQLDSAHAASRDDLARKIEDTKGITILSGVTAQGFYAPDRLMLTAESHGPPGEEGGTVKIIAGGAFVFATGAQDLIPLFENNDMPGVFGCRALRLFLERDGLVPGRSAVVYGQMPDIESAVGLLEANGIAVAAVAAVDRSEISVARKAGGDRVFMGARLVRAEGRDWIARAVFELDGGRRIAVPCDLLCVALPGQPAFELSYQAGFAYALADDPREDSRTLLPKELAFEPPSEAFRFLVGQAAGKRDWREKVEHAAGVGTAAARSGLQRLHP
jgi:NADPH-dependent 2,4-dienoyl-CoA reductase/sulfur reductase-like enzyme